MSELQIRMLRAGETNLRGFFGRVLQDDKLLRLGVFVAILMSLTFATVTAAIYYSSEALKDVSRGLMLPTFLLLAIFNLRMWRVVAAKFSERRDASSGDSTSDR